MRVRFNLLFAVGVILVFATLGMEFAPHTSKGIGPLQWYGVMIGVVIIMLGLLPIRWSSLFGSNLVQKFLIVMISLLMGLVTIEYALSILHYTPLYSANAKPEYADGLLCASEAGCYWNRECPVDEASCQGYRYISDRWFNQLRVNWQSWYEESLANEGYQILVTGDSFTAGASADIGFSWVEDMYARLATTHDNLFVWNTAIGGTATGQAAATARYFMDITEVDLVLTGFYASNDYFENLVPIDLRVLVLDERNKVQNVSRYRLGDDFEAIRLTEAELYYRVRGLEYIPTGFETLLYRTRIGSIVGRAIFSTPAGLPEGYFETATERTRENLIELRATTIEQGTPLIILLIPSRHALSLPNQEYETAKMLFEELAIPYIDILPLLIESDYAELPDIHWSNQGHGKAADMMTSCVEYLIENEAITCPDAI